MGGGAGVRRRPRCPGAPAERDRRLSPWETGPSGEPPANSREAYRTGGGHPAGGCIARRFRRLDTDITTTTNAIRIPPQMTEPSTRRGPKIANGENGADLTVTFAPATLPEVSVALT